MTPYEEGKQARRDGVAMLDNPYANHEIESPDPWQWSFGWQDQLAEQVDWLKENMK